MHFDLSLPNNISEFKASWRPSAFKVKIDSEFDVKAKDWCRKNLKRHEWSFNLFTNEYEHTFLFMNEHNAIEFEEALIDYVVK